MKSVNTQPLLTLQGVINVLPAFNIHKAGFATRYVYFRLKFNKNSPINRNSSSEYDEVIFEVKALFCTNIPIPLPVVEHTRMITTTPIFNKRRVVNLKDRNNKMLPVRNYFAGP